MGLVAESIRKATLQKPWGHGMHWWIKLPIAIAVVAGFAFSWITPAAHAADHRTVGMATNVVSPAQVENEPAAVGTLAHMNDELRTGAKARLQVSFRDST